MNIKYFKLDGWCPLCVCINKAVNTINNWQNLCDQGVSIALNNSSDMSYLKNANSELKSKTSILISVTNTLKSKLATYGYN